MFDELDFLRSNPMLITLLAHYASLGASNREAWQPRVMEMDGCQPADLVKLHGNLLAFGWIEQNTGQIPACYRITSPGLRASRQVQEQQMAEADLPEAA